MSIVQWEHGKPHFKHGNPNPDDDLKPKAVEKAAKVKVRLDLDATETKKAQARSKGQCEVVWFGKVARRVRRCQHPIMPGIHHMVSGWGKRARGISLLADHKQAVCRECHDLITRKVLRRIGGEVPRFTDEYERVDR